MLPLQVQVLGLVRMGIMMPALCLVDSSGWIRLDHHLPLQPLAAPGRGLPQHHQQQQRCHRRPYRALERCDSKSDWWLIENQRSSGCCTSSAYSKSECRLI